jgi:hypothetical protein
MLQQAKPGDYVIATGETHSVTEFCELAFSMAGLDYRDYVKVDERFYRPAEVDLSSATPQRRGENWAGNLRSVYKTSFERWSTKISGCTPDPVLPRRTALRARISTLRCCRSSVRMLFTEGAIVRRDRLLFA